MVSRLSFWLLSALILTIGTALPTAVEETNSARTHTWKTVEDLSPQERQKLDLATDTPRHPQVPYLPAEPYPFTPPYTAEEMGYRTMEFTFYPRWSAVFARAFSSISDQGVLLNPGSTINFLAYNSSTTGVEAELALKPGEEIYRYLSQRTAPAAAEGSQRLSIRYRTGKEFIKKEERFRYSQTKRRVRHDVPRRRQGKIPNMAFTPDDTYGRDAWEFSWQILGLDTLYQTVRFPKTRPAIILRNGQTGQFQERRTAELKLMGDSYRYYTAEGGVRCYVVEARARPEWLPDYYVPRLLFWLEEYSFFPLRIEKYGPDGNLSYIEVRLAELFNPALGERGYGSLFTVYWDIADDLLSYFVNDSHRVTVWKPQEVALFFSPDFMRRQWYLDTSIKTQAQVPSPALFFLRPTLEEEKFPEARPLLIPPEIVARVQAQEAAGRLVFEVSEQGH
ncbi:MAG: hypothetical protein OXC18_24980 [Desulfurellaceae bacterium]|nr:hypothetical protein [Desulfurellaceae bacterium]